MMKTIGLIPIRKGSKGIKNKNKRKMLGRPLFSWVLTEALFSDLDTVYIYTDDDDVIAFIEKEFSWTTKVVALKRSDESASDTASTEFAMIEFAEKVGYSFDQICLLQATSPMTTSDDINKALSMLESSTDKDSLLSVVRTHRFIWSEDGKPLNYDVFNRPRRQDFNGLLIENGAVYITSADVLSSKKNRVSDSICLLEMHENSLLEIDDLDDWRAIEQLLIARQRKNKTPQRITHVVLDVDGVFTDGSVTFSKDGELSKDFDMRDGMGLEILRENDVEVIVMTSEDSEVVAQRMKKLKIENLHLGVKDKFSRLRNIVLNQNLSYSNFAYIGDDINDLSNMLSVGWSIAPNNAVPIIKMQADTVLTSDSRKGAIREACEFILKYNNRFSNNN